MELIYYMTYNNTKRKVIRNIKENNIIKNGGEYKKEYER